jgi:hypothetical protein
MPMKVRGKPLKGKKPPKPKGGKKPGTVRQTGNWLGDNWGWLAGGGLLTWIMVDDGADDKLGDAFGKVGGAVSGILGGLLNGLMPLLLSSCSLACVIFMFFSAFTATSSRMG